MNRSDSLNQNTCSVMRKVLQIRELWMSVGWELILLTIYTDSKQVLFRQILTKG